MSDKSIEQTFENLKKTVPLLIKHHLSAIPTHYALWYTYVANEQPSLNKAIEQALADGGSVSAAKSEALFREFVADEQDMTAWQLRQSMEAMLQELDHSMQDTRSDTQVFKQVMDSTLDDLSKVEKEGWSMQEVMALVRKLVKETQAIRKSTITFNGALQSANQEIQQLRAKLAESEQAALYDALTGLCNRRYFDSEIDSKQGVTPLSIILLDLDHFKQINDNHGHLMGDLVLKAVAKKLQDVCRDTAQVFRYGGEEFAVLMPGSALPTARQLAETMRRSVEKLVVKDRRSGNVLDGITASVGVAERRSKESVEQCIDRADGYLYDAKRLGRNRVMPMSS
ncbi:GGDEF domain-containing protein [Aestuariibacter halophilus]|uniref:diguanylate cyclase n=1 Tax=Fluctibacter halophilus TaxID=226011 RepID=A0ABS8GDM8_9ALTE|nr:GGDEF domain-containing protein [Aestuariibacter halophilus]MCC2618216.1 GGDEF domain-containing protein [Aestuariibacter halophilus]